MISVDWNDKKYLKSLFNIDDVIFDTYRKLPMKIRFVYLCRFKKDKITLDEFDSFCSSSSESFTKELKTESLSLFNIECKIPFYINKDRFIKAREENVIFSRDIKLKLLLCQ